MTVDGRPLPDLARMVSFRNEHCGALKASQSQAFEGLIGVGQREFLDLRADRNARGQSQKFLSVSPGQIRDRAETPFFP